MVPLYFYLFSENQQIREKLIQTQAKLWPCRWSLSSTLNSMLKGCVLNVDHGGVQVHQLLVFLVYVVMALWEQTCWTMWWIWFFWMSLWMYDELACKEVAVTGTSPAPPLNVHLILAIWSHHIILIIH